ncbi:MAG: phenylacetate--CoA ligase family protein [Devosia sp.]|nr:phenylacetate--CoA ligase family protein [Devosia sp.]
MSILDVARGAYTRAPRLVRKSLAPLVSLVPTGAKYGRSYQHWRQRIATLAANPASAHAAHLDALRGLLGKAHDHSPFYRELLDRHLGSGFDYNGAMPEDLRRLPILKKWDLEAAGDAVLTVPRASVDRADTSGSNAERPFGFYLDRDRSPREQAFVMDSWSRAGFSETDSKIVLRGVGLDRRGRVSSEWEPALRELRLSVFPMSRDDVARYADLIDHHGVRYLYGYPSAIVLMASHLIRLGRSLQLPLKGILPISEPLLPHQRAIIAAAFGDAPIANFYGLSEKVLFANESMTQPGHYTFQPLYGLAELVDEDDRPVTEPGREGRLIGTGFLSTSMPFIRYDTHDRATLVELPSEANGQRMQVSSILPRRKPDYLIAADGGRIVSIDLTPEKPRFFTGVEEFQFVQHEPGKVTMRYVPAPGGTEQDALNIVADLEERVLHRLSFTVQQVEQIASGRGGKRTFIDQRLDMGKY